MASDIYVKANASNPIRLGVAVASPNRSYSGNAYSIDNLDHIASQLDNRLDDAGYYGGKSPNSIRGLVMWLNANADVLNGASAAADGDPITSWLDQSVQENNVAQSTANKRPTLEANVLNGYPIIRFDGIDDVLTHSLSLSGVPQTAFAVAKRTGGPDAYQTLLRVKAIPIFARLDESANWGTYMGIELTSGSNITSNFTIICTVIRAFNDVDLRTNGVKVTRTTGTEFTDSNDNTIGNIPNGTQPFGGDLAELIVYNRSLSSSEVEKIERYLNLKYEIY